MLSRVARNIYWLARYLERAENTARMINVHGNLLLDLPHETTLGWDPLIAITGNNELFYEMYPRADEHSVIHFLLMEEQNPSSVMNSLAYARESLRTSRDIIPREVWEQVNDLSLSAKRKMARGMSRHARYELLEQMIRGVQQIAGMFYGVMNRDQAYDFMRMGTYLERGDMTTRIIDVRSANLLSMKGTELGQDQELAPFDNIQWMSVLKSLTAYQAYRQHTGMVRVRGTQVLAFLMQYPSFPRSLSFCADQLSESMHRLPRNGEPLNSLNKLRRKIIEADVTALAHDGLHEFIDELQVSMGWIHQALDETYFSGKLG